MSELSWNDVREGDKVKVKHERGSTIEGTYEKGCGPYILISGLSYNRPSLELLEHTPAFKNFFHIIAKHGQVGNFAAWMHTRRNSCK